MTVERDSVRMGDATISYQVRRSRRRKKTVSISVHEDGVRVAAPMATPRSAIRSIVLKRARWILEPAARPAPTPVSQRLLTGETLPYLGRDIPVVVESLDVPAPEVLFDSRTLRVHVPRDLGEAERHNAAIRAVMAWYGSCALETLTASVERWRPLLGYDETPRVLVRNQRSRWGSCAPDGTLRFNWRLMMVEPNLIDYLVVHELAHLTHPNHSADFWKLVSSVIPDVQQRRKGLREAEWLIPF